MENQVGKSHDVIKQLRFLAEVLLVDEGQGVKDHEGQGVKGSWITWHEVAKTRSKEMR